MLDGALAVPARSSVSMSFCHSSTAAERYTQAHLAALRAGAALLARAGELARTVADNAPLTLRVTKEALRRLQARMGDDNIDDLIRLAYGSADFREGMAAFLAKRAPKWSGA